MGKTGKWIKSFLIGKKDQKNANSNLPTSIDQNPTTPVVIPRPTTPKEKKRWSFRRSSAAAVGHNKDTNPPETTVAPPSEIEAAEREKRALAVPVEVAAAEVAAAQQAATVMSHTNGRATAVEEAAATKIQSVFRSYLARKALKALRGLVKLQALVRGHLVRKQATTTLRCMQALITAQARARAQRILRSVEEGKIINHWHSTPGKFTPEKIKHSYHDMEENIKIVEMDRGEFKSNYKTKPSYSNTSQQQQQQYSERMDNKIPTYYSPQKAYSNQDYQHISPSPSAITDLSPRTCSGHFEDYSVISKPDPDPSRTAFSFPTPDFAETMSYDYPLYPNYMANTESSRAKVRSQSAPKQRPELERQPSRGGGRRPSVEGRNIPRGARMQRSSSHVGSTAQNYHYPWSVKLDKSTVSLQESECGSSCSVFTNANYCRSLVNSYGPRN